MNPLISSLQLQPHPEGGWYRELYRSPTQLATPFGTRCAVTTIHYLLEEGQLSRWHVVTSDEIWHFYAGTELELLAYDPATRTMQHHRLSDPAQGGQSVAVIAAGVWQAARVISGYTLVGCTVAPGFEFSDFQFVADLPDHPEHFAAEHAEWRILL